jgi:hypothetical protein
MTRFRARIRVAAALCLLVLSACPSREPATGYADTIFNGTVTLGTPVEGATVTAVRLSDTTSVIGSGVTDADGRFTFNSRRTGEDGKTTTYHYMGDALVCAVGGSVDDAASGVRVPMGDLELCMVIEGLDTGEWTLHLNPWTQLAVAHMRYLMKTGKLGPNEAFHRGVKAIEGYIGCADTGAAGSTSGAASGAGILKAAPIDPTKARDSGTGTFGSAEMLGLLEGGRSMAARLISEHVALTPGKRINTVTLAKVIEEDLSADGLLDGVDAMGPIDIHGYTLDESFYRGGSLGLAQGLRHFVLDSANATGFGLAEVKDLLACLPATQSSIVTGAPEELDTVEPTVAFLTPVDGDVIASSVPVSIRAEDNRAIASLEVTQGLQCLDALTTDIDGKSAAATATLNISGLADGAISLAAATSDTAGNADSTAITVVLDRAVPAVQIVRPAAGETVRGTVQVEVHADDPNGIKSVELVTPSVPGTIDLAAGSLVSNWDTTELLDGSYTISAAAYDVVDNGPGVASASVVIDNVSAGHVSGSVCLETCLSGGEVVAYAWVGRWLGDELGHGLIGADGTYGFDLADNYKGPVQLVASGTSATYKSAVTGLPVRFEANDKLVTAFMYEPGSVNSDKHIHGFTTLAVGLASWLNESAAPTNAAAIAQAFELFDDYLDLDSRSTRPSNMLTDVTADSDASQRLGLLHAALAYRGAVIATSQGSAVTTLPSHKFFRTFLTDLGNYKLDGLDAEGYQLYATSLASEVDALTSNTLRFDLAFAAVQWLRSVAIDSTPVTNVSGLVADNYTSPGAFLYRITTHMSELFGDPPPLTPDFDGPAIVFAMPTQGAVVAKPTALVANVLDVSELEVVAFAPNQPFVRDININKTGKTASVSATIDPAGLSQGAFSVALYASDKLGNTSSVALALVADTSAPTIEIQQPVASAVVSGDVAIRVLVQDDQGVDHAEFVEPVGIDSSWSPTTGILSGVWHSGLVAADGPQTITISATDNYGHVATKSVMVATDNYRPSTVGGRVALESPVAGATVECRVYTSAVGAPGALLGSTTSKVDGTYSLQFPDNYAGPVRCRAMGTAATYASAVTKLTVRFDASDALETVFLYAPTADGALYADTQIHAFTTLGAAQIVALAPAGGAIGQNLVEEVYSYWDIFLGLDSRATWPSNMLANVAADSDASQRLGLLHAGLAYRGAMIATSEGSPVASLPSHKLLRRLQLDLGNGVLDGLDNAGLTVFATPMNSPANALTADTLRFSLAIAAVQWLRGVSVGGTAVVNSSGLTAEPYIGQGAFLWLISTHDATALFRDPPALPPDFQGPVITFQSPSSGTVVTQSTAISASVKDESALATVAFAPQQGLFDVAASISANTASIMATLDPATVTNGAIAVKLVAVDVFGNTSDSQLILVIDTAAPSIEFLTPVTDSVIAGDVLVQVSVKDPQGVSHAEILSPGIVYQWDPTTNLLTGTWKTAATALVDGKQTLVVSATDSYGHTARQSISVVTNNFLPGKISGRVALESPVGGVTVSAHVLDTESRTLSPVVSMTTSSSNGDYTLNVPDSVQGYLLITAKGTAGVYTSAVTGQPVDFLVTDELLTSVQYAPSIGGTNITDVHIHGVTTLVVSRALSDPAIWSDALEQSSKLFSLHYDVDDVMRTAPADMLTSAISASGDSQKLGLAHAGWAYLGAQVATGDGIGLSNLPTMKVVGRLRIDLEDLILNGRSGTGAVVYLTNKTTLGTNTCRFDQATAIGSWLTGRSLGDQIVVNTSSLDVGDFDSVDGFLWRMSMDTTAALFGSEAPTAYDQTPPIVGASIVPESSTKPIRGQAVLDIEAQDASGIRDIVVWIDGALSSALGPNQFAGLPSRFRATIETAQLQDGLHVIRVSVTDIVNNKSTKELGFWCDNTPPTVGLSGPSLTSATPVRVNVTTSDNTGGSGVSSIQFTVGGIPFPAILNPKTVDFYDVNIECNSRNHVTVTSTDLAGNTSAASVKVDCDNDPPRLSRQYSEYLPESQMTATYDTAGSKLAFTSNGSVVNLNALGWNQSTVISKFFNRLDEASSNLPVLIFTAVDTGDVKTSVADLLVEYRYLADGYVWRDWTYLPPVDAVIPFLGGTVTPMPLTYWRLPLTYQTLSVHLADSAAQPDLVHRIEIRIKDLAGNYGPPAGLLGPDRGVFEFKLSLLSPPLVLRSCTLESGIQSLSVTNKTLDDAFVPGTVTPFSRGEVRWDLALPSNSLAPLDGMVELLPSQPTITFDIESKEVLKKLTNGCAGNTPGCHDTYCGSYGTSCPCTLVNGATIQEAHVSEHVSTWEEAEDYCVRGYYVPKDSVIGRVSAAPVNGTYAALSGGAPIPADTASGAYVVTAAKMLSGAINVVDQLASPTLTLSGSGLTNTVFTWPETYTLPPEVSDAITNYKAEPGAGSIPAGTLAKMTPYQVDYNISKMKFAINTWKLGARYKGLTMAVQRRGTCDSNRVFLAQ